MKAQLLYQTTNITGEGVTWLSKTRQLLWVDIEGKTLYTMDVKSGYVSSKLFGNMLSTIIPHKNNNEFVILAMEDKLASYNLSTQEQKTLILLPNLGESVRTNDGKASPDGRIFLGIMHLNNHNETGFLYRIDNDLSLTKIFDKQCIPNGMLWDAKGGYYYYIDSGKSTITRYKYDQVTGELSEPQVVIQVPKEYGVPDGMTIDSEGKLWVAHWGGYGVYVWNVLTGKLEGKIEVPAPNVASCTFGGKDMNILYITTARAGLSDKELEKYPLSGSLFSIKTNSKGAMNHYPFQPQKASL